MGHNKCTFFVQLWLSNEHFSHAYYVNNKREYMKDNVLRHMFFATSFQTIK